MEDIFAAFGDIFGGGGVFGDLFGGGRRARGGPRPGRDLKVVLDLTLEEIDQGVAQDHRAQAPGALRDLPGQRRQGRARGARPAPPAAGRGQVHRSQGFFTMATVCPRCHGAGQVVESPCATCRGGGFESHKAEVEIEIPAGIEEGVRLRVPEAGDAGQPGAPRGDLYCVVREVEHRIFQRNGADVITEVPVSFAQMALGDTVEVPTLRGRAEMTIPAGTPNGKVFRLRGQGLPLLEGRGRGDQLVRAFIEVPRKLSERQKELLREYAELESSESKHQSFFEKIVHYFS